MFRVVVILFFFSFFLIMGGLKRHGLFGTGWEFLALCVFGVLSRYQSTFFSSFCALEFFSLLVRLVRRKNIVLSAEAVLKYFIISALGSLIRLISYVVGRFWGVGVGSGVLFAAAFAVKLGLYPWGLWALDFYRTGRLGLVFSALVFFKIPYFVFLMNWGELMLGFNKVYFLLGLGSVFLASVGVFWQTVSLSRFLGYSSFVQVGYLFRFLGLGAGAWAVCFFCFYSVFMVLIGFLLWEVKVVQAGLFIELRHLTGYECFGLFLLLVTFARFPLTVLFVPKFVLVLLLRGVHGYMTAVTRLFIGIFSAVYYLRILKLVWSELGR